MSSKARRDDGRGQDAMMDHGAQPAAPAPATQRAAGPLRAPCL